MGGVMLGTMLVILSFAVGASLAAFLAAFPLPVLAVSGLLHMALLKDLRHPYHWALALVAGVIGFVSNLAIALIAALLIWWIGKAVLALSSRKKSSEPEA